MKNNQAITARVIRFRDLVAIDIGSSETVYLKPKSARAIARALNAAARSCGRESFADSTFQTAEFIIGKEG